MHFEKFHKNIPTEFPIDGKIEKIEEEEFIAILVLEALREDVWVTEVELELAAIGLQEEVGEMIQLLRNPSTTAEHIDLDPLQTVDSQANPDERLSNANPAETDHSSSASPEHASAAPAFPAPASPEPASPAPRTRAKEERPTSARRGGLYGTGKRRSKGKQPNDKSNKSVTVNKAVGLVVGTGN